MLVPQAEGTPVSIQDRYEPDAEERGEEAQVQAPCPELSEFRGSDGSDTETISHVEE